MTMPAIAPPPSPLFDDAGGCGVPAGVTVTVVAGKLVLGKMDAAVETALEIDAALEGDAVLEGDAALEIDAEAVFVQL